MTLGEVIAYLRVSRSWLRREAAAGNFPSCRVAGKFRFLKSEVNAYLRGQWKPATKPSEAA